MIKFAGYQICLLDLVCDHKTGKLDKAGIWYHVANIIMSKIMLTQTNVDWELMAAYGAIVGGSYAAILFMKWKYRDAARDTENPVKLGVE